jgi:hypothetical protein
MFLLIDLPEALLSSLLSTWLTLVDVARVDSAVCCTAHRNDFLRTAYHPSTLFHEVPTTTWRDHYATGDLVNIWILRKGASVTGFYATAAFLHNHELRSRYLHDHGGAIRWLEFMHYIESSVGPDAYARCIRDIVQYCPNLTRMEGMDCLDEASLISIARSCALLEDLDVGGEECTHQAISELAAHCTTLRKLSLRCSNLDDETCLIALVRANPGLHTLSTCAPGATEAFLRELPLSCPGFADLTINQADVTQEAIYFLLQHCANLSSLYLEYGHFIPPEEALVLQPTHCPSMRTIVLSSVDILDEELDCLLQSCPNLTELDLSFCEDLEDLDALAVGQRCLHLQKLIVYDNASVVGDQVLLGLSKHCPDLCQLQIHDSELVTDLSLAEVIRTSPQLQHLDVQGCKGVTDRSLVILPECCPELSVLILSDCVKVTEAAVNAVIQGCAKLTALNVDGCKKIKAKTRNAIHARYPSTQYV